MVYPFPRPFPGPSILKSFSVLSLFSSGEQGAWYDPSDFNTMFQDSAGTTPVTAVEQPVGLIRDKSGRGNHASQSTAASRPVLSARVNRLTYSEQFDNAAWTKDNFPVTSNADTAPNGTTTANLFNEGTDTSAHNAYTFINNQIANTNYTFAVFLKYDDRQYATLSYSDSVNGYYAAFDLVNGTKGNCTAIGSGVAVSSSITPVSGGWYLCAITGANGATSGNIVAIAGATSLTPTVDVFGRELYTGTSKKLKVWGADLRVSNDGVGIPAYQRIAAATDYDTTGFPYYLAFDGTDDSLATSAIDFSAADKMTVFAGVRKQSDAAQGVLVELSSAVGANNGSFVLFAPATAATGNYDFRVKGSTAALANTVATYTAPITSVLTGTDDISGDLSKIRVNGVLAGTITSDQGTGNFGAAYPLYIGRRNNSSLPFNGRLYSLIVRGATSSATQIADTETWVNLKTGAY